MSEFPEEVVKQAWARAQGKCECRRVTHFHPHVRCDKDLVWENRGREGRGAWEAHDKISRDKGGESVLSNCEILCRDCHTQTF